VPLLQETGWLGSDSITIYGVLTGFSEDPRALQFLRCSDFRKDSDVIETVDLRGDFFFVFNWGLRHANQRNVYEKLIYHRPLVNAVSPMSPPLRPLLSCVCIRCVCLFKMRVL